MATTTTTYTIRTAKRTYQTTDAATAHAESCDDATVTASTTGAL